MIPSPQVIQNTITQLTGLCASLAQECGISAASVLFSDEGQKLLAGQIAAGFPTPDRACHLRPVATAAVIGYDGHIWGLLVLSEDHAGPLSSQALLCLRNAAETIAARLDRLHEDTLLSSASLSNDRAFSWRSVRA